MKYELIIHQQAIEDLRRNSNWWKEHHSSEQAIEWFDHAFEQFYQLETFPKSHL